MKRKKANVSVCGAQPTLLRSKLAQPPKRVFILGAHPVFRAGLTQILSDAGDLMVCGTAGVVTQALPAIASTKPDLVLADIDPPGKRGLKLIKELRSVDPSVKLLVVSRHNEAVYVARVMRLGGDGYVMKQGDPDEIVFAIHDVLKGCIYISEEVMERPGEEGEARISEGEFVHGIAPRIPSLRSWNWLEMARTDAKRHSDSELTGSRFIALNPPPKAFGRTGRQ